MALTTSVAQQAAFESDVLVPVFLIKLDTRSQPLYLTNWPLSVETLGQTFIGLGNFGTVGSLRETEDGQEEKLTLTLSAVNLAQVGLFLGNPTEYQDRDVLIWLLMLDKETHQPTNTPMLRFAGLMDQVGIVKNSKDAKITMDCRTGGYAARNNPSTLKLTNVQHQERHPGELGLSFVQQLIDKPIIWASKKFQASQV